jgi:uncharacterized protein (TIGR02757 family)
MKKKHFMEHSRINTDQARNLCELYERLNRREYVHPDPLEFLYDYPDLKDREIVGLIASSLAYGAVRQILRSVRTVLQRMGASPSDYLGAATQSSLSREFRDFKHRFTTGEELATMLLGAKRVVETYGSLGQCFVQGSESNDETVIPALTHLVRELSRPFQGRPRSLLPSPELGSACKRLNLYLRWMVRRDRVDPGGWDTISPRQLLIPLDVHMFRISQRLGLTLRKQANLRTACEITAAFRKIEPEDPVRYDFVLTRLGIRDELNPEEFLRTCNG